MGQGFQGQLEILVGAMLSVAPAEGRLRWVGPDDQKARLKYFWVHGA